MGAVRHDDLPTCHITMRAMIVVNRHQTCQLAMRTSIWFKSKVSQAREFAKRLFQEPYQGQCPPDGVSRLFGMQVLELGLGGHLLVDFGVILHRT